MAIKCETRFAPSQHRPHIHPPWQLPRQNMILELLVVRFARPARSAGTTTTLLLPIPPRLSCIKVKVTCVLTINPLNVSVSMGSLPTRKQVSNPAIACSHWRSCTARTDWLSRLSRCTLPTATEFPLRVARMSLRPMLLCNFASWNIGSSSRATIVTQP